MSRPGRRAIAVLFAGTVLSLAGWLDGGVMLDLWSHARAMFSSGEFSLAQSLGSLAVVSSVLLLGVLAWRAQSALVGATYALVGAFFVFLPVILWRFATWINDSPPVLQGPIADAVTQIYLWSVGPLNAVGMIGAGMFVVGLLVVGRSFKGRSAGRAANPLTSIDGQPIRP